jgi:hypothetical protein
VKHAHGHRHSRGHPHAYGRTISATHDHEHEHTSSIQGSWIENDPYHREHRHTAEEEADLRRQTRR